MGLPEMLDDLPKPCDVGTKKNSKGYQASRYFPRYPKWGPLRIWWNNGLLLDEIFVFCIIRPLNLNCHGLLLFLLNRRIRLFNT